jgi:hypothetical protein
VHSATGKNSWQLENLQDTEHMNIPAKDIFLASA